MAEKCLQCVQWQDLEWPDEPQAKRRMVISLVVAFIVVTVWTAWLIDWWLDPWGPPIAVLMVCLVTLTGVITLVTKVIQLLKHKGSWLRRNWWGEVIFLSVDTEHFLHVHRQESAEPPLFWIPTPCCMWQEAPGEQGRCVARDPDSALL